MQGTIAQVLESWPTRERGMNIDARQAARSCSSAEKDREQAHGSAWPGQRLCADLVLCEQFAPVVPILDL